jgi:hypothetical protein
MFKTCLFIDLDHLQHSPHLNSVMQCVCTDSFAQNCKLYISIVNEAFQSQQIHTPTSIYISFPLLCDWVLLTVYP